MNFEMVKLKTNKQINKYPLFGRQCWSPYQSMRYFLPIKERDLVEEKRDYKGVGESKKETVRVANRYVAVLYFKCSFPNSIIISIFSPCFPLFYIDAILHMLL